MRHVIQESPLEALFRVAATEMGVFHCFAQELPVLGGRFRFDFTVIGVRLAIELDSDKWHGSVLQKSKDRDRDRQTEAAGWVTIRFKSSEVAEDARACVWIALRAAKRLWDLSVEKEYHDLVERWEWQSKHVCKDYPYTCCQPKATDADRTEARAELEKLLAVGPVEKPAWLEQ